MKNETLQENNLEKYLDSEATAVMNYLISQGFSTQQAYPEAAKIKQGYEDYYSYANTVGGIQRWIEYETVLECHPDFEELSYKEQASLLWEKGWDTLSYRHGSMNRLLQNSNGQRTLKKVLYGWERSDRSWVEKRNDNYEYYASFEARLVADAKRYGMPPNKKIDAVKILTDPG